MVCGFFFSRIFTDFILMKPVIAIVGRPNVGKSTLFNKLAGKRVSIVEDTPGVTRDRIYYDIDWNGRELVIVDTGGIEPKTDSQMLKYMRRQAEIAVENSDVIIFICDVEAGVTADDREIAQQLKKSGKPVICAVNKIDKAGDPPPEFYEFYELGFENDPIALSSMHGTGTGDLLDLAVELSPPAGDDPEPEEGRISVAVIGHPNVGKSSLVNRVVGSDRLIVSDVAGTTRDAIDVRVDNEWGKYTFVDTAGMRRQSRIDDGIEYYSVLRAKMAVERADICLVVVDAVEGITDQDARIAGIAHESGKSSIIVVNKWDLVEKETGTMDNYTAYVREKMSFMSYAPVIYVSALTGQRCEKLYKLINDLETEAQTRVTTGKLNDMLTDAVIRVQPPSDKGRRLKLYYVTQTGVKPATFVIFVNNISLFHFSYQRYIENQIREVFGLKDIPIRLIPRQRGEKADGEL